MRIVVRRPRPGCFAAWSFVWWASSSCAFRLGPALGTRRAADAVDLPQPGPWRAATWVIFLGGVLRRELGACLARQGGCGGMSAAPDRREWPRCGCSARFFSVFLVGARCRSPSRSASPACRVVVYEPRLSPMMLMNEDLQGLQLVHPARGCRFFFFFLPADRET